MKMPSGRHALVCLQDGKIETSWSDAVSNTLVQGTPVMLTMKEGMIRERRQLLVNKSPEALYQTVTSLGGQKGWLYMNWASRSLTHAVMVLHRHGL